MDNGCKRCTENRMMNEEQLITGCRKGDRTAQKELYELYSPRMLGVCLRYIGDRETARDVLQDGFVKVFSSFGGYKGYAEYSSTNRWNICGAKQMFTATRSTLTALQIIRPTKKRLFQNFRPTT